MVFKERHSSSYLIEVLQRKLLYTLLVGVATFITFAPLNTAWAGEVATWLNQSTPIFIDKIYSNHLLPNVCWKVAKPELVAKDLKALYLRIGLFDGQDGEFPCLTQGFQRAQKSKVVDKLVMLKSIAIACSISKQGTKLYYPEKILCTTLEPIKSCLDTKQLPEEKLASCINEQFDDVALVFEELKESAPTMFKLFGSSSSDDGQKTLTLKDDGKTSTVQAQTNRNGLPEGHLGPLLPAKDENFIQVFNQTNSLRFPEVFPIEIATTPFVSDVEQDLLSKSLDNPKDDTTPVVAVKAPAKAAPFQVSPIKVAPIKVTPVNGAPVKKEQVSTASKAKPQKPTPAPFKVHRPPPKPLTVTQMRYKKYYTNLPTWAKKVHETAIRALSPKNWNFIREAGACSAFVRQVFQAAMPEQSYYLDVQFFGGTAAGIYRGAFLRESTIDLWNRKQRIRTIDQVMKYAGGLRPGDVVFQDYGFGNAGHIGIVIINQPIYARNHQNINMNDSFVIAENTQRHCKSPAKRWGCPADNRGIVSIRNFGHITHVGRFGGFGQ